jgi:hypothetical protein
MKRIVLPVVSLFVLFLSTGCGPGDAEQRARQVAEAKDTQELPAKGVNRSQRDLAIPFRASSGQGCFAPALVMAIEGSTPAAALPAAPQGTG